MAIFHTGDTVAVERSDGGWSYGILRDASYGDDVWVVDFENGRAWVPENLIREDEREPGETVDHSVPSEYERCLFCSDYMTPSVSEDGKVLCSACGVFLRLSEIEPCREGCPQPERCTCLGDD